MLGVEGYLLYLVSVIAFILCGDDEIHNTKTVKKSMGTPMSKIPFFLKNFFFRKIKHVLAPQDDFGMQKKTWQTDKKSGFGSDPPPGMGKIPT